MDAPIVVVGAGLAGLSAAGVLADAGRAVTVLDDRPIVGGRLATAQVAGGTADHGAQFFTVRSDDMRSFVEPLIASGAVFEWCRGFNPPPDGYPRYAARAGMTALAAELAAGLDVRTGTVVTSVAADGDHWVLGTSAGDHRAAAVVLTPPVPQSLALLSGVDRLDPTAMASLGAITYHRTLALLVALGGASAVPAPGARQLDQGEFSFVADNAAKGVSPSPVVTFHTAHATSERLWERPDDEIVETLWPHAQEWLGAAPVLAHRLERWAHAGPRTTWPDAAAVLTTSPGPLVLAGDAFSGPKFEGARLSGVAAARALLA